MGENRLAKERSSYLRSAANQPVHWLPWGEEAFTLAKAQDKPILLDIGAVWCHWCHVIDRESYEDPTVAAIINEKFVAVKVDRDERPDVDARYQRAVAALSGQGGWPLTAFLTPDGKVFYGGTYFPPEEAHGRPSFRKVLNSVSTYFRDQRQTAVLDAENLHRSLAERHVHASQNEMSEELLVAVEDQVAAGFDAYHGGFGTAPKFPHPGTMEFILARHWRSKDSLLLSVITRTLTRMALGGVYDQLGGGFHRYSVDQKWIVPHFEKMSYDNAELLRNYAHAFSLTANPLFRDTAQGILRWVESTLSDRANGGFYASQDADYSLDDDGDYFTWTLKELRGALTEEEARVLALQYNVAERGEMKERPDRNVLWVEKDAAEIAKILRVTPETVTAALESGRAKLLAARARRPTPFVDTTIYAAWNGMFISASLEAWRALGDEDAKVFALKSLDRLLRELYVPAEGFYHQLVDGQRRVKGLLDDQAQMLQALLDAYEATTNAKYLKISEELAGVIHRHFTDPEGGFSDTATGIYDGAIVEALEGRRRPLEDNPTPSPNGVVAMAFGRLYHLTGKEEYQKIQKTAIEALSGEGERFGGIYCGTYFQAADLYLHPPAQAVIVGGSKDPKADALHRAALVVYSPGKIVLRFTPEQRERMPELVRPMLDAPEAKKGAAAFVCKGMTCDLPTDDPERVRATLSDL